MGHKREENKKGARAHVRIRGRVQGVFFRGTTQSMAASLGLKGYVRNLRDGSVEAVYEGAPEDVRRAVNWSREGPVSARVESVDVSWSDPTGEYSDFRILR